MDRGIDGYLHFRDADKKPQFAIVSVKGGENVSVAMVRDLAHVVEREKAKMGLFISLSPPTDPMNKEALKAGFYTAPNGKDQYRKIQIATIADLLESKKPDVPPQDPTAFSQAPREESQQLTLVGVPAASRPQTLRRKIRK